MTDTATESAAIGAKVPVSFWIIAVVSLLWNAFGGYDYVMTETRNADYLKNFPAEMLTVIDAMPPWATAMWAIGVWGSVAGSVLLLLRSRHAVTAFLISFVAAVISFAYQSTIKLPASLETGNNWMMTVVILVAVVFFWWFSRRSLAQGILK